MREKLLLSDGRESDFLVPFHIYNEVQIRGSDGVLRLRPRLLGVSFSESGEIIIGMAICSESDPFDKKKAKKIVEGRIRKVAELSRKMVARNVISRPMCYYFPDLEEMEDITYAMSHFSDTFFVQKKVVTAETHREGENQDLVRHEKTRNSTPENIAEIYFAISFIRHHYAKIQREVDEALKERELENLKKISPTIVPVVTSKEVKNEHAISIAPI